MNPEHWQHPGLGLGSPNGLGAGKSGSQEPRSGINGIHESRVGNASRSDAHAGTICPWFGAEWPDGATVPMIGWCLRACPQGSGQSPLTFILGTREIISELVEF